MRQLATLQDIAEIRAIPGADKIVAARINGWWVVTQKEGLNVGDKRIYFEIDSLLPLIPQFEFLAKGSTPKKMLVDGKEVTGYRLKTIKLKGQVSQGLVLPWEEFSEQLGDVGVWNIGEDVSEKLGILKYEKPMPAELAGKAKGNLPGFLRKTDEERIQNMPDILAGFYVTEKLDGSSATYYKKDGVFGVCSRNLELIETEGNSFWKFARDNDIENKLPDNFAIQGELVGEGLQGNPLKIKGHKVFFFNAFSISGSVYLNFEDFKKFFAEKGLETVPILNENFALPPSMEEMLKYAEGTSALNSETQREGVVVRPKVEMEFRGQRLSFKVISNKYLLDDES